ncbi:MAG: hypothetical protein IJ741_07835 [Schwartzia sp.]|nr:hypothetical protein [Schwartzia sp. (in: firmicutes)]MBR1761073.1 hypothetical protein [Schwartzia sp. (in: firmicutes)]
MTESGRRKMTSLEWIELYMAFAAFQAQAEKRGLYAEEIKKIEDDLFDHCPIPQPQPMEV